MVKYKSRVNSSLKPASTTSAKEMVDKVLSQKSSKVKKVIASVAPKIGPVIQKISSALQQRYGAVLPIGGKLPDASEMLSDSTIDQLSPHVFIHMLSAMDNPTFHILQGIAANYLNMEHPLRKVVGGSLPSSFIFPKKLSKIAMRDILKGSQHQVAMALHGEWLDMMDGKLTEDELGGGLFSSLKTLVKKGVSGAKVALSAVAKGAKGAVRALSGAAMGAQTVGRSVNNALMQGIEIANSLAPVIQQVFPKTEGVLKAGLGHANAAQELLNRGIDISSQVERALAPAIEQFGPLDDPIVVPFVEPSVAARVEEQLPVGAGISNISADIAGSDISGPRFVS